MRNMCAPLIILYQMRTPHEIPITAPNVRLVLCSLAPAPVGVAETLDTLGESEVDSAAAAMTWVGDPKPSFTVAVGEDRESRGESGVMRNPLSS